MSGEIAKNYGNYGMSDNPIKIILNGTAGQSLGVWNAGGVELYLTGDANDYVGKGMAGGKIIINATVDFKDAASQNSIIGNTCLYGATGGRLYAEGKAGERFAVRNSGAISVIEGAGDHCCEYMTGGCTIVLGSVGTNFGAGMTGGIAFVYDRDNKLNESINQSSVELVKIQDTDKTIVNYFKKIMRDYINETKSINAKYIMKNISEEFKYIKLVKPINSSMEDIKKNSINKVA